MSNAQPAARPERTPDQVIGENVHTLMWRAGLSQSELAPQWGMTQASLSLKLRGKRPWFATEINAAAGHFKVTRDALFTKLPDLDSNQEPIGYAPAASARGASLLSELPDVDSNHEPAGIKPAARIRATIDLASRRRPRPQVDRPTSAPVLPMRRRRTA